MPKVYLCGSIANAQVNSRIASALNREGFNVFDPCTIVPNDAPKMLFSEDVYARCKRAIEDCDVLLVFLDSYGKDSAWEVGFARGLGKVVVGLVTGTSLFLEDWMVRFSLDRILVAKGSWLSSVIDSTDWSSVRGICDLTALDSIPHHVMAALDSRH